MEYGCVPPLGQSMKTKVLYLTLSLHHAVRCVLLLCFFKSKCVCGYDNGTQVDSRSWFQLQSFVCSQPEQLAERVSSGQVFSPGPDVYRLIRLYSFHYSTT